MAQRWELGDRVHNGMGRLVIDTDTGEPVCEVRTAYNIGPVRHGEVNEQETDVRERLIAAAPDLLSLAKRWAALDAGSWHVERHAAEKAELLADTKAAISGAGGEKA